MQKALINEKNEVFTVDDIVDALCITYRTDNQGQIKKNTSVYTGRIAEISDKGVTLDISSPYHANRKLVLLDQLTTMSHREEEDL